MKGHQVIYGILKDATAEGEALDWCNYFSGSELLKIQGYPAIIVEEEPFDWNQSISTESVVINTYEMTVFVIVERMNTNEMSEENVLASREDLQAKVSELVRVLLEKIGETPKVVNLALGRSEIDYATISSKPVMVATLPVSLKAKI